ncbi:hypothetical protein PC129_g19177 [Phytophthora cactorum]|uniref:Uncharacterized protein n=1 Tax=Phytophthora cactorum TaxID=29920 RepID=A0A8T1HCF7_9STRA|nr:hypothetical protein PC129_g19177 [Phytophthora cactorum]
MYVLSVHATRRKRVKHGTTIGSDARSKLVTQSGCITLREDRKPRRLLATQERLLAYKMKRSAVADTSAKDDASPKLVELRRRRRRSKVGQYVLEHELRPPGDGWTRTTADGHWTTKNGRTTARWVNGAGFERLHSDGRVVEDTSNEEVL